MSKKLLSLLLALVMIVGLVPMTVMADGEPVAKVGETQYTDFDDALTAWTAGTTLTLLANVETTEVKVISASGCTLNLGNYTWTAKGCDAIKLTGAGGLTINAEKGGITADNDTYDCIYADSTGLLTITGGTYNGDIYVSNGYTFIKPGVKTKELVRSVHNTENKKIFFEEASHIVYDGDYYEYCSIAPEKWEVKVNSTSVYTRTNDYLGAGPTWQSLDKYDFYGENKVVYFTEADDALALYTDLTGNAQIEKSKTWYADNNKTFLADNCTITLNKNATATYGLTINGGHTVTVDASATGASYTGNVVLKDASAKFVEKYGSNTEYADTNVTASNVGEGKIVAIDKATANQKTFTIGDYYACQIMEEGQPSFVVVNGSDVDDAYSKDELYIYTKTQAKLSNNLTFSKFNGIPDYVKATDETPYTFSSEKVSGQILYNAIRVAYSTYWPVALESNNPVFYTLGDPVLAPVNYKTFDSAYSVAKNTDKPIILLDDLTPTVELGTEDRFTVELNGHTFTDTGITAKDEGCKVVKTTNEDNTITYSVAEKTYVAQIGDVEYETLADAFDAAKAGETVKLIANCTTDTVIYVKEDITLDLGTFNVTPSAGWQIDGKNNAMFSVNYGASLTIDGTTGSISTTLPDGAGTNDTHGLYAAVAVTNIESIAQKADPAKLTVNGGTLEGYYYGICGNGNRHNTEITINGGTVKGVAENDNAAIYHPQNGSLTINGGELIGAIGIYVKSGIVTTNINGGTITANGIKRDYVTKGDGFDNTGDALVLDNCDYPGGEPNANIQGGKFSSENGSAVASYAKEGKQPITNFLKGGYYTSDVSDYVAEGYQCIPTPEGDERTAGYIYMIGLAPTAVIVEKLDDNAITEDVLPDNIGDIGEEQKEAAVEAVKDEVKELIEETAKLNVTDETKTALETAVADTLNNTEKAGKIVQALKTAAAEKSISKEKVEEITEHSISVKQLEIVFDKVEVKTVASMSTTTTFNSISYNVTPVVIAVVDGKEVRAEIHELEAPITFRLAVNFAKDREVVVYHTQNEVTELLGSYIVKEEGGKHYVELSSQDFSEFTVVDETVTYPNKDQRGTSFTFNSASLTIADGLTLNLRVTANKCGEIKLKDSFVKAKINDKEITPHYDETSGVYKCDVDPEDILTDINFTLYAMGEDGNVYGVKLTYSVKEYCTRKLGQLESYDTMSKTELESKGLYFYAISESNTCTEIVVRPGDLAERAQTTYADATNVGEGKWEGVPKDVVDAYRTAYNTIYLPNEEAIALKALLNNILAYGEAASGKTTGLDLDTKDSDFYANKGKIVNKKLKIDYSTATVETENVGIKEANAQIVLNDKVDIQLTVVINGTTFKEASAEFADWETDLRVVGAVKPGTPVTNVNAASHTATTVTIKGLNATELDDKIKFTITYYPVETFTNVLTVTTSAYQLLNELKKQTPAQENLATAVQNYGLAADYYAYILNEINGTNE